MARGDEESLVAFHDALLNGSLLVAAGAGEDAVAITLGGGIEADGPAGRPVRVGAGRDVEENAVVLAFTGDDELNMWGGWDTGRMPVAVPDLARAVLDAGVHEVSINPAGPIGRRLDVVELRQLASGVRPRVGRASFGFDPRSGVALAVPAVAPASTVTAALVAACAHNADVEQAYVVEMMQPRRSGAVDLAVALALDPGATPERRAALLELIGAVVTGAPGAALDGIGFLWLDARLAGIARSRMLPAYERGR